MFSNARAHLPFLIRSRVRKDERRAVNLLPVIAAGAVFILGWEALVIFGSFSVFLPAPELVAQRFVGAWLDGTMWRHASATLVEIGLGFLVGAGLAVGVGYLLARSRLAERLLSPYIVAAQATPVLVLAPLLAVWLGTGLLPKVVICALIVFFPVAIATMVGIRSVDQRLLEMARSLRASPRHVLTKLELPAALPQILGGMRVGVTLAVIGAIVGEWAGADRGLGVLINLARGSLFDYPLMFATLVTINLIALALYLVVLLVERALVGAWR
ncbi:MAG: putative riboflavin transport system permease protein [Chloroflexota bacterium]|jgi:NitT/TauT family transport system permease protein|nr:putative riboflavin transport system permease protein [Chloroflexota bacterium]